MSKNGMNPLMVMLSMSLVLSTQTAKAAEAAAGTMKKTTKALRSKTGMSKELILLNQKVDVLNKKVVQLEHENGSLKRSSPKVAVKIHFSPPHLILLNNCNNLVLNR